MGRNVVVVIGVGGMGEAIARRQGPGNRLLLADFDEATLAAVAERLRGQGHEVVTQAVDVSSASSVTALAEAAAGLGAVTQVVHTAGLSPVQASPAAVLRVDLLGTALVVEEFGHVVAPGGAGVVIASMAGHMLRTPLTAEQESALAHTPAEELLRLPFADPEALGQGAYGLAKYGNRLRVQAASAAWGARGARINSVSPGVIATPMGQQELDGASGRTMRAMVAASGTGRLGTPEDIAEAAAFLLGPGASFITGNDLLVDGGVVAALRSGRLTTAGA
ncbi:MULTISPECIES: SDR family oxidoreductase [Streptomyces]|uniref:SDR family oxidoreductase n=1 Tax=Streptomyces TaxID=1883 RepID=UPI0001AEE62B|nr:MULTISPECIES: SDR family oxidoreductase [Streptomyces]BDH50753.1 short-chain dehydrogenase/reductase [Streptomyces albus]AGI88109.1 Short-chain type dehydrogenase/reductase [Streptomyces albidoflavus]EFE83761.1 short-chain type dehydrogenase/reductase [Streptomyces albidoflavus]MBV7250899.1 SDR family oxidoreductase [Streptomyces sp. S-2]QLP91880.1 Short-chain type dehydrogenase/reductase [Streptomyces albidoflavus]